MRLTYIAVTTWRGTVLIGPPVDDEHPLWDGELEAIRESWVPWSGGTVNVRLLEARSVGPRPALPGGGRVPLPMYQRPRRPTGDDGTTA